MAELLDEFKEEEEESLSIQIKNATDNVEILMNGGMLTDLNGDIFKNIAFVTVMEDGGTIEYDAKDFIKLDEYIVPLTDNEKVLMDRISELEEQIKVSGISALPKRRKIPVTISEDQEMIVVDYYLDNKDDGITIKEIAAKYNISGGLVSKVLEKHKVRIPFKRNRQITYGED